MKTQQFPHDKCMDSSLFLLLDGYKFINKRCNKYKSDIFQTRLLGEKVICMSGEENAKLFYNNRYMKREGAAPKRIQKTLFGKGGVQGLDGEEHANRKLMFMSIMTPENLNNLESLTRKQWEMYSKTWTKNQQIVLFDETQKILCQVACKWAGVPLRKSEINMRASDLGKMVDGFGAIGPRYYQGKCARKRTEQWIRDIILDIRKGMQNPPLGSPAYIIAWQRDPNAKLLNAQIAAVELINIIRPIVAIATFITFGALAMRNYPDCKMKIRTLDEAYTNMFIEEVRRFYPFTPFVGARVKKNFKWRQYQFKKDTLVLLDIRGMNCSEKIWNNPDKFYPERFQYKNKNPFEFMPQGGGDYYKGHRCPGEFVTILIMKVSFQFLVHNMKYKVPKQNLNYKLSRIPTLPKSRFVIQIEKIS